ncbi:hypothetical protein BB560_006863, partial [Smittium megazygosporum]
MSGSNTPTNKYPLRSSIPNTSTTALDALAELSTNIEINPQPSAASKSYVSLTQVLQNASTCGNQFAASNEQPQPVNKDPFETPNTAQLPNSLLPHPEPPEFHVLETQDLLDQLSDSVSTCAFFRDFNPNNSDTLQHFLHNTTYRNNNPNLDISSRKWSKIKKHYFILSSAGKPIYSRYGDESKLSPFMGIIQALISTVFDLGDEISTSELELEYVYDQVLSILTYTQLSRIFEKHTNFDLRRLLGGTENILDNLIDNFQFYPFFNFASIEPLSMKYSTREKFSLSIINKRPSSMLFAFIAFKFKVVTLVRPKKVALHPSDVHLLLNMATSSSSSLKSGEAWTPICLPRFNNTGFLFAYISMLLPDIYLYLISTDQSSFYDFSNHRKNIKSVLKENGTLATLKSHLDSGSEFLPVPAKIDPFHLSKWICFKSKKYVQLVSFFGKNIHDAYSDLSQVSFDKKDDFGFRSFSFFASDEQKRIMKMFTKESILNKSPQICYLSTVFENVVAWATDEFEIYGSFELDSNPQKM